MAARVFHNHQELMEALHFFRIRIYNKEKVDYSPELAAELPFSFRSLASFCSGRGIKIGQAILAPDSGKLLAGLTSKPILHSRERSGGMQQGRMYSKLHELEKEGKFNKITGEVFATPRVQVSGQVVIPDPSADLPTTSVVTGREILSVTDKQILQAITNASRYREELENENINLRLEISGLKLQLSEAKGTPEKHLNLIVYKERDKNKEE